MSGAVKITKRKSLYDGNVSGQLTHEDRDCFLIGNTTERTGGNFTFTVHLSFYCRDSFLSRVKSSKAKMWAFYPPRDNLVDNTVAYIDKVQDAMRLLDKDRVKVTKTECGKAVTVTVSPFWSSPLRVSFLSLLCRAAKHFDPKNEDIMAPLEHTVYTRSRSVLYAANRFISGWVDASAKTGMTTGWRDTFVGETPQTIDKILSRKYTGIKEPIG